MPLALGAGQLPALPFLRRQRAQGQGMNLGLHGRAECRIDGTVAADEVLSAKRLRDDEHAEVAAAGRCADVAGVPRALVLDDEVLRRKRLA